MTPWQLKIRPRKAKRSLRFEQLEQRLPLAVDLDDQISEAVSLGAASVTPVVTNASITPDTDVDMYAFTVTAGQVVDFDIDTPLNGPGGLGSFIRLFNSQGQLLAANNDGLAPGENVVGFDAYLRFTFSSAGTFYLGVSNATNTLYSPITGDGDVAGGTNATGTYTLTAQALPVDTDDAIPEAVSLGAITTTPKITNASINPDIDVDMYSFTVTAGQIVDFDIDTPLNGPGGLGSFIRLFNSLGQQLVTNNDAAAPGEPTVGFDSYLRFTFATAGTYYLGVSNANNTLYNPVTGANDTAGGPNSIGNYTLTVQTAFLATNDADDQISEAVSLGAISATPVVANGSITPDTDVDMYAFTVTAGQVVDFDIDTPLNGPGGLGSFIRLFNSLGQQLATNNDAAAPGEPTVGFDAYLRFTFPIAGTFFLGVSNANNTFYNPLSGTGDIAGGANATGTYQLIVQAVPVDTDDSIPEAVALGAITTTPSITNASINPDIDVDMYSFTVTAGQVVDFDIDTPLNGPGGLGSFIRLFNSLGQQLATNNDAAAPGEGAVGFDSYLRFTFATAGTYYLGVSNANNTLYNPVTGAGDAVGGPNSIGNYTLTVQTAFLTTNDTDDQISEVVPLGAVSATPIVANGSITPDTDVDMYAFTVTAGQVVDFDIDTPLNGPGGLGSFIRLFNILGQQLAANNDAAAPGEPTVGFDAYLRFTFPTAGTFYLGVSNANNISYNPLSGGGDLAGGANATGTYQLIVQTVPVDTDDSIPEAVALGAITATPSITNASINPDIDVDMYSFTVAAGQVVDFDIDTPLNGLGGLGSFIRLFNSLGQQLATNNDAAAPGEPTIGFDSYLRFTFAVAGTYYLGVSNANNTMYNPVTGGSDTAGGPNSIGSYTLTVQTAFLSTNDTDDQISEAVSLGAAATTPTIISANISPDTDVDMYTFTVTAGQVVDFDIDTPLNGPGGLGSFLKLFTNLGIQLAANDDAAAPGENVVGFDAYLRFTFTVAGTYYLGVSNNINIAYNPITGSGDLAGGANATGAYTLTMQAIPVDTDDAILEAVSLGTITSTPSITNASINPDIDVDMYSFTVGTGQTVDIDIDTPLNGPGGLGSFIRLFNSLGQQLVTNNDAAAPGEPTIGFDSYLRFTFATGGTYYLGISNANNMLYNPVTGAGDAAGGPNSIGNYTLTVQTAVLATDDLDDTIAEAISLGAASVVPVTYDGSIASDKDVDMFKFTVAAGQVVDFDIDTPQNGPGGLGSFLRLFNGAGQFLAFNNDGNAPGENVIGFDAYLRFTFTAAGTYYLGISNVTNAGYNPITGTGDVAGGANPTGNYQLTMQALPVDTDDATSEAVALGAITATPIVKTASINPDIDVDMYSFTVTAGQTVDFDIDTPQNGPGGLGSFLRVFNNLGNELAFNNDAAAPGEGFIGFDAYLRFTFATAGTYFVGVSNANNTLYNPLTGGSDNAGGFFSIGSYTLTVQTAPFAFLATALSLEANKTAQPPAPIQANSIATPATATSTSLFVSPSAAAPSLQALAMLKTAFSSNSKFDQERVAALDAIFAQIGLHLI